MTAWGETTYENERFDRDELGGISPSEVVTRGKAQHRISDSVVLLALKRVEDAGVIELLDQWRREDGLADPNNGGRPVFIPEKALLVGMLLLAQDNKPLFLSATTNLFLHRISDTSRELLGLPQPVASFTARRAVYDRWYNNTHRAFSRLISVMDPFPVERRSAKYYTQIREILNNHDVERERARRDRLNEFTHRFLAMTYRSLSRRVRRTYKKADVTFDQTYLEVPNSRGYSRKTLPERIVQEGKDGRGIHGPAPVDPFAAWHVRDKERVDHPRSEFADSDPKDLNPKSTTYRWGLEANLAIRVDAHKNGRPSFPRIVTAATLSLPNIEVAEEAVELLRRTLQLGLTPGIADADMQYWANSITERLHEPALAMGWTPSTDYRKDRLGPRGGNHGALYMEGHAYCPATPKTLLNTTADRKGDVIDVATFLERKKQQRAFRLHQKEKPAKGKVVMRCPALGPSPTVICPLRELLKTAAKKPRPEVENENIPPEELLDKICRQHAVTFDEADFIRDAQAFEWGTPEWQEFHSRARNLVESSNGQAKDEGAEAIQSAARRRVRGFAAAQVTVTLLLTTYNLRKIAAFLDDTMAGATDWSNEQGLRRRDRDFRNAYTGTYPAWITPPEKKRRDLGDGTGGPPTDL